MLIRTFLIKLGIVYDDRPAKEAEDDLEDIGEAAAKAKRPMDGLDRSLEETTRSAKTAGAATARAGRQIQGAGTQAATTATKVGRLDALMGKLGASLASLGPQLAAAGVAGAVAGVGQLISFVGDETARLDKIAKDAQKTGFGVEEIQKLGQVATLSGSAIEILTKGVSNLNIQIDVISRGGAGPAAEAFEELGLTFEQLQGQDPTTQLEIISRALEGIEDPADKSRVAFKLMGEEGKDLIPLFNSGADAIREMSDNVGKIFTREELARAEAYQDALAEVDKTAVRLKGSVALALAPAFQRILELSSDASGPLAEFAQEIGGDLVEAVRDLARAAAPWVERLAPLFVLTLKAILLPIKLVLFNIELMAELLTKLFQAASLVLTGLQAIVGFLETRFPRAFAAAGTAVDALLSPLETVRGVVSDILNFVERTVDGIGDLGKRVRSIRAAVGLGGGSLTSAQSAAAALQASASRAAGRASAGEAQAAARDRTREEGRVARATERARGGGGLQRMTAARARRVAAARPSGGGGGGSAAPGFLESLGLNAPGSLMAKRPAPNTMTIVFAPIIKMVEKLEINVQGGTTAETRRALDDAASQARDAVFAKLSDLPALAEMMFRLQAKSLQAAGSAVTRPGGN